MEYGFAGLVAGSALFMFPGLAWASALAPGIGAARGLAVSVVLAFTLAPGTLFLLNLLFDLPIRLDTMAALAGGLGMAGVAVRLRSPVLSRMGR